MPVRSAGLAQQAGFALGLGAWMTLAMWVVARVPWAGVFGLGTALGWVLLDYWLVLEAEGERRSEVSELEKQVVSLRTMVSRMCPCEDTHGRARALGFPSEPQSGRALRHAVSDLGSSSELGKDSSGHSGGSC